jgi:hypothetical protein
MMPCGSELSPPLLRSPLTIVTCCLNGSSGFRMGENAKSLPTSAGDQRFITAPCGK